MILLAGFLEVFFKGFLFLGLALSVGGIFFQNYVLLRAEPLLYQRTLFLVSLGAFLMAASQALCLWVALLALTDDSGHWPTSIFLMTGFAKAGLVRMILSALLGLNSFWIRKQITLDSRNSKKKLKVKILAQLNWFLIGGILFSGAFMVHGASRLENVKALMVLTVLHQIVASIWVGGTLHLVGQWSLFKKVSHLEYCWPELLKRFSLVAFGSVALLIMAGAYLYFQYVGNYLGLIGTAYGTMLLTKVTLMSGALLLGVFNFAAIQQWRQSNKVSQLYSYTPYIIETEAIIGIIILFAAAAFTSQPPAIDVVNQRSSPKEVLNVFVPKIPQWVPASMEKLNANISSTVDPYAVATPFDKTQSNFNHNISGIFVILLGLGALLQRTTSIRSMRHWPLLFFPFWLFLLVFAQPTGWPLGKRGFIESLWAADVLQHRLGTLFVVVLGVFEWRVQTQNSQKKELRSVFPILCFLGGALLLSHSHSLFPDKSAYLIEVSHNAIGILAVLIGAGSWLELRLSGYISRIAGYFWPICFMLLGYVLFVYKEL